MKATELRIGNKVNFSPSRGSWYCGFVTSLSENKAVIGTYPVKYVNIEPIPLTDEILERCGFECSSYSGWYFIGIPNSTRQLFVSTQDKNSFVRDYMDNYRMYFTNAKGLHTIQNLFFALTGEELTINL